MSDQNVAVESPDTKVQRFLVRGVPSEVLNFGLVALLCVVPLFVGGSWMFTLGICFANSIGVLAVSTLVRYGGEVSIGHGFFAALGAYSVAILDTRYGLSIFVSLPLALTLGVISGILFAWPSRKLSGIYLAVSTMALALAVPEMINNADGLTGGYEGLYVSQSAIPGIDMSFQRYYAALVVLIAVVCALARLRHSRQGLTLLLSKAHPAAADAFGTRKDWARIVVMGISGGIAALCGATLGFAGSTVSPSGFTLWASIFLLVGSVVSFYGLTLIRALVGGAFLTLVPQFLSASGAWIPVFYGLALLGVILLGHYLPRIKDWIGEYKGAPS
ncbi:branched-chain amino acid ABC transporter permease [Puniceibacterium sp. IMCC21224]|uniref:branched-chain amino acid ABC transporter permease n=1 Tax=Puniceibacterium sp. IMCC21224 TaxID=1618204 RepID=UPI00064D84F4|nr:branched-chain amino acid ABC transporter permease [Puniceibacterium sp. IMCC21224]KMK65318.1 ABC-type branched-chain amino acid transport system, permease component [Puniceibacterium sp. IMCC21224]